MKTSTVYNSFKGLLLLILLSAVSPSFAFAANYCGPIATKKAARTSLETEAGNIVAEVNSYIEQHNQSRQLPALSTFKTLKGRIEALVNGSEAQHKFNAFAPLLAYYDLLQRAADQILRNNPNSLTSLRGLTSSFGVVIKKEDVMWLVPQRKLMPSGMEVVYEGANARFTLTEPNVLMRLINAQANAKRAMSANYYETAKCLLSAAVTAKYSYTQMLQGKISGNVPAANVGKACGQISFAQLFVMFKNDQVREPLDKANRYAFLASVPNFSTFMNPGVLETLKAKKWFDNGDFLSVYMGGDPTIGSVTADDRQWVQDEIGKLIGASLSRFGTNPALIYFFDSPGFANKLADMTGDCQINAETFAQNLRRAEELYFIQAFELAVGETTRDFSGMTAANYDDYLYEVLVRVKMNSMSNALLSTLMLSGKTYEEAKDIVLEFTQNVIMKDVPARLVALRNNGAIRTFTDRSKSYFTEEATKIDVAGEMRRNHDSSLIKAANDLADMMAKSFPLLPFKKTIAQDALQDRIGALNPEAQRMVGIVLSQNDFAQAKKGWERVLSFVKEDSASSVKRVQERNLRVEPPKSFWSWDGFKEAARNVLPALASNVSTTVANSRQEDAKSIKQVQDLETVKAIGYVFGYSHLNAEPKILNDVTKTFAHNTSNELYQQFAQNYRKALRSATFADYRSLEMPYNRLPLYRAISRLRDANGAAQAPINYALLKTSENQQSHLFDFARARKIEDLNSFILRSNFLGTLLGETDMDTYLARRDFWPSIRALGMMNPMGDFVFPHLIQYHAEYRRRIIRDEIIANEKWDDFYTAFGSAANPLIAAFAARWVMTTLRVPLIPSIMKVASNRAGWFLNGYWNAFLVVIVGDMGAQAYRWRQSVVEMRSLHRMAFSESTSDRSIAFWIPLIDEASYTSQLALSEQTIAQSKKHLAFSAATLALPVASYFVLNRGMFGQIFNSYKRAQSKADADAIVGNTARRSKIETEYTYRYSKFLNRKAHENQLYFRNLGVPKGTWKVSELRAAMLRATGPNKVAADEAYKALLGVLVQKFATAQSYASFRTAFIRAAWGSEREAQLFSTEYNRLYNSGARR